MNEPVTYFILAQLFGKAKPAIFMTILVSGIVHEYVLAIGLGFANPVLLVLFAGPGGESQIHFSCSSFGYEMFKLTRTNTGSELIKWC